MSAFSPALRLAPGGPMLAEEVPVALVHNGATTAVMMATPADLEDFATGFALTEGLAAPDEIDEIGAAEIVEQPLGIEARLWLPEARAAMLAERRRAAAGPVGCGLCGIDSLAAALRPVPRLAASGPRLTIAEAEAALEALRAAQPLHDETRSVHGAGFWRSGALALVREDVGRHNALDKLAGGLARAGIDPATGTVVMTSRLSLELVQKCAMIGAPMLVSVSAPTAHAVRLATEAGVTLASRAGGIFRLHSHPSRFSEGPR